MPSQTSHVLRLSQFAEADADTFRVEFSLDGGAPVRTRFQFQLSPQDQEDLRWYLEDYLQYPLDPAPTIAARIETRMRDIGIELFRNVFESGETARRMWARLQPELNDTRVEIGTEVAHATAIPWELLRDPLTDEALALRACAFVRVQSDQAQPPKLPRVDPAGKIRILLAICRPNAGADVPFRSVASRIVKSLSEEAREYVQLDVLRPPTFEQLGKVLREAKARGQPYHVVHFDGHGLYADVGAKHFSPELQAKNASPLHYGAPRAGKHGYLLFENPQTNENITLVDGLSLGKLLVENDVPALVLNACQSAMAEAPTAPLAASESGEVGVQVRAFGSLAQEVMDTGVAGVVAMRYILYVETAKRFVADLYAAVAQGQSLGEAVTFGRKQLAINPQREIAYKPINLQDWLVPIVYEVSAIELFPVARPAGAPPLRITLDKEMTQRGTEIGLPPRPDVGFFGRDETLLALDRAFDSQRIVLLHAFAGSGKTTTAAEFARWYALTGGITLSGVEGQILFTSFERRKTLAEALNETIGRAFNDALEQSGVHWLTLTDEQRRAVALQVMQQLPMLWIWDNVEPVTGFPAGTPSVWNAREQRELVEFLAAARETKAKFLLTSRRDERGWLGDLPRRIIVPPMPMQERVELARAIAEKFGHRITAVDDWSPLLRFTQGNPLTITVLVGQALRDGLRTRDQIVAFVERLRKGETAFADEESEARSKSLGASLSYGFENAFTETERKQLALLHFFQGFVDVDALVKMGALKMKTGEDLSLPEVRGLTREAGIVLLDRAAEIGLLTAHGHGYYSIHPALPWYFKSLFEQCYPTEDRGRKTEEERSSPVTRHSSLEATRAFTETMGAFSSSHHDHSAAGDRDLIALLSAEETNLLYALQLARANGWWKSVAYTMQGLDTLYNNLERTAKWAQLVNSIIPDFTDPVTNGPLAGREEGWFLVSSFRVDLARRARQFESAYQLSRMRVEFSRLQVAHALTMPVLELDNSQRKMIRNLASSLAELGNIMRDQGMAECITSFEEAIVLYQRMEDPYGEGRLRRRRG